MQLALSLIAQGRGDDPDGIGGVVVILASIVLVALMIGAVATLVIRRSRRSAERTGPRAEPHSPGHGGRVSGVERDIPRR